MLGMEPSWDDMRTVMCLVRGGSLAAAAHDLGLNYTTVARRIKRVEAALGVTLFDRLVDGYQPTEAGALVANYATQMNKQTDTMMRQLQGRDGTLRGSLTVTAPQLLIAHVLTPVIEQFCAAYPDVDLHVRATNDLLDLNRREADLAIRISRDPGDSLMGVRLASQQSSSFAAPAVAQAILDAPTRTVDWIVYADYAAVPKNVNPTYPNHRIRMTFDDMVAIRAAVVAGLGVARMPVFLGRSSDGLVQVPVLAPQPYPDIWIVAHRDVWASAKVAAFREMLVPFMRGRRAQFVC
jgi:DNA-binding transcriptional LysR family regulator